MVQKHNTEELRKTKVENMQRSYSFFLVVVFCLVELKIIRLIYPRSPSKTLEIKEDWIKSNDKLKWLKRQFGFPIMTGLRGKRANRAQVWSILGFPGGTSGEEHACQRTRHKRGGLNPWVGKVPWRRAWHPLQYSCLENPMRGGAWQATVHRVAMSWTWLSN